LPGVTTRRANPNPKPNPNPNPNLSASLVPGVTTRRADPGQAAQASQTPQAYPLRLRLTLMLWGPKQWLWPCTCCTFARWLRLRTQQPSSPSHLEPKSGLCALGPHQQLCGPQSAGRMCGRARPAY